MTDTFHRKFLRPRAVKSDQGFEVEFRGMLAVRYSEEQRTVTFAAEPAVLERGEFKGHRGWMIGVSSPQHWDDGTAFGEAERDRIQDRTRQALEFMKVPLCCGMIWEAVIDEKIKLCASRNGSAIFPWKPPALRALPHRSKRRVRAIVRTARSTRSPCRRRSTHIAKRHTFGTN